MEPHFTQGLICKSGLAIRLTRKIYFKMNIYRTKEKAVKFFEGSRKLVRRLVAEKLSCAFSRRDLYRDTRFREEIAS